MSSYVEYFPHDKIRLGQDELLKDLEAAFSAGKILLAHAPTGLGKTASVLSTTIPLALEKKKIVFFLTNRHTQHKIAIDTLKLMQRKIGKNILCVDFLGKKNMCQLEIKHLFGYDFQEFCKNMIEKGQCEYYINTRQSNKLTTEAKRTISEMKARSPWHNEELNSVCKERKLCSYELALELAKEAQVFIGDYYYLFNPFVHKTIFKKLEKEVEDVIVIIDEAHNLPARVMEMLSNNLTSNMIRNGLIEAKKFGFKGLIAWLQELMRVLIELACFSDEREKLVTKEDFMSRVNKFVDYDEFIAELEEAAAEVRRKQQKSYLGGICGFLEFWRGEDQGFARIISEQRSKYGPLTVLSYLCLDPGLTTKDIFSRVHAGVLMSGTLKPTSMYKDVLGITKGMEKEYLSPFPPENQIHFKE